MSRVSLVLLAFAVAVFCACASSPGGGQAGEGSKAEAAASKDPAPPPGSPLSKVELGMNDAQVRNILGNPHNQNSYVTGKSWIPYYYGTDTSRTEWMYKGMGRVVYSRNRYSGTLKVIRIIYNPDETAGM
jgi:outer membrane protein assembly factor BamE (lipoprotein component of BamABCDE complex)